MLAAALILVLALAVVGLVIFVALLVGMRSEPTYDELSPRAPSLLAALARRTLGVSVRKSATASVDPPREPWFAAAGYTPINRDDEDR